MATQPETIYITFDETNMSINFGPWDPRDASKDTDLMKAILSGNLHAVETCLKTLQESKTLAEALSLCDASGKTAFALACSKGKSKIELVKALFPHLTSEILKIKDSSDKTAFDYAIQEPDLEEICFELMRNGLVSPFDRDKKGNNALMLSISCGRKNICKRLILGADTRFTALLLDRNSENHDALDLALINNEYEIAAALVEKGSDIEKMDEAGNTRLMLAVKQAPDKTVQFLKQHRANINAVDKNGDTVFLQMIRAEHEHLVRYLMEQAADITVRDRQGKSALDILKSLADSPKTRRIAQLISSPPPRLPLPIDYRKMCMDALSKGDKETLAYAVPTLGENFLTTPLNDGLRPIHIAARLGHRNIVEFLIEQDVHQFLDEEDNTALMLAAAAGHLEIVRLLHNSGLRLEQENKAKENVTTIAAKANNHALARYLQEVAAKNSLEIPKLGLTRDSFVESNSFTFKAPERPVKKGLALILEYFQQKDKAARKKVSPAYVADNLKAFQHGLSLLGEAREGMEYGLIYTMAGHSLAVKCEKINGENHFILMDSLGSLEGHPGGDEHNADNHADAVENIIAEIFSSPRQRTFFYKNRERRQTSGELCCVFAVKDLRKMLSIERLSFELTRNNHIIETTKNENITVYSYRTPARFMRLAQSYDALTNYGKENKEEAEKYLRLKTGKLQRFMDYALTVRDKFGIVTPERIENRNFGPEKPDEPQYAYKNHSIFYFGKKYIAVIDRIINSNGPSQLKTMIESHNAEHLKIGPNFTVMSSVEERILLENQQMQRLRRIEQRRQQEEKDNAELKMDYEATQQQMDCEPTAQQRERNYGKSGIIQANDTVTAEELGKYICSADNPWNGTLISPSFLFSKETLIQFKFDRTAYLKELINELRDNKQDGHLFSEQPCLFSVVAQAAQGGLTHYKVGSTAHSQTAGEAHPAVNTQAFVDSQPSAKKRKVMLPR